jgi:hypothetical protein
MMLIGSRRIHLSLLSTILVVAAFSANLLIWERNATRAPVRVSIDVQQTRSALDQHERHPGRNLRSCAAARLLTPAADCGGWGELLACRCS